jgi:hypothetical protein
VWVPSTSVASVLHNTRTATRISKGRTGTHRMYMLGLHALSPWRARAACPSRPHRVGGPGLDAKQWNIGPGLRCKTPRPSPDISGTPAPGSWATGGPNCGACVPCPRRACITKELRRGARQPNRAGHYRVYSPVRHYTLYFWRPADTNAFTPPASNCGSIKSPNWTCADGGGRRADTDAATV